MRRIAIIIGALLLATLTGCGSSYRVFHDKDPSAAFDSYQTYSFLDWSEGNKESITGIERERIRVAIAKGLEEVGLKYQAEGSDLKVKVTVYFREAKEYQYYYPGASYNYMERALAMDIFEGATKKHIWHSAVVGEVEQDPVRRAEELPELVAKMLARFPVKKHTEI